MASVSPLKRSSPEAEGIPSKAVLEFVRALEKHVHPLSAVEGFVLLRHGNVAAEGWWRPYGPECPHPLQSLSKSFTSSAIGLAIQEGLLTVDDPVLKFFSEDAPAQPCDNLKAMRVRHLLSMNTGHKQDTTEQVYQHLYQINVFGPRLHQKELTRRTPGGWDDNWPRVFLSLPVEHQPGSWFVYNTAATYMLSAIITKLTGQSVLDYLRPRLFDPLGIENPFWETDPKGVSLGGSGLHGTVEDIARFGQLYLQQGTWDGKRILAEEWIAEATSAHSDNSNTQTNPDWTAGYGYQFWHCRHNCYRGDGAFGQYCIIMPEQDAVLAMIGGLQDMQPVLDKVWRILLPEMHREILTADPAGQETLREKLAALSLPLSTGRPLSPVMDQWSGKSYKLETNYLQIESITIEFREGRDKLTLRDERGEHTFQVGYGTWLRGSTSLRGYDDEPVAANGAWTAENTYEVRFCYYHTFFCPIFRFHYMNSELQIEVEPNVSWQPLKIPTIRAHVF
ncbi:MAG: serine hydrolase [Verrucomicrobia bacterium]|nr:serine hydrolase [Verrucomicrobiota bacterium]